MQGKNVKVEGTKVTIQTGSAATARELAAAAENEVLKREGGFTGGVAALIDNIGDFLATVSRRMGHGTFELIGNTALIVGSVIAFVSWTRLLPLENRLAAWGVGAIGVAVILAAKVSAGRWAEAVNEGKVGPALSWKRWAVICLLVDALAAFAFSAAVVADEKTGRIDYQTQIEELSREARQIEYAAADLDRPNLSAEILQMDLDVLLNREAKNSQGAATGRMVRDWIGWGAEAQPTEAYCITAGNNTYYIDLYCEDVIEAHRNLMKREAYEAQLQLAEEKRAEAERLKLERPAASSAAALGGLMSEGQDWGAPVGGMLLMFVVLLIMVTAAFIAKRDFEIEAPAEMRKGFPWIF